MASRAITIPSTRFNFSAQSDTDCVYKFRFTKQQIVELVRLLRLPDEIITTHRYKADPLEAICNMLNLLAWPHRLGSMVETFGRSHEALSAISKLVDVLFGTRGTQGIAVVVLEGRHKIVKAPEHPVTVTRSP